MSCLPYSELMRRGYQLAIVLAAIGFGLIIVPYTISAMTYVPCNYCSDRNYGPSGDPLLGIMGIFLLGLSAIAALNAWKPPSNKLVSPDPHDETFIT